MQQTLLGLDIDAWGTIQIYPCVPLDWYNKGFGQDGCGVSKDINLGYLYQADRVTVWIEGSGKPHKIRLRLPPQFGISPFAIISGDNFIEHERINDFVIFELSTEPNKRIEFVINKAQ